MTIIRLMLSTVLFGSLALPVLAQPVAGAHQVRATHHRTVRHHAPVHRIATSPAALPDVKVTPAVPATRPSVGATASVTPAPLGQPMAVPAAPRVTTVVPGTLATPALPGAMVSPALPGMAQAPRVAAPAVAPAAKLN